VEGKSWDRPLCNLKARKASGGPQSEKFSIKKGPDVRREEFPALKKRLAGKRLHPLCWRKNGPLLGMAQKEEHNPFLKE